MKIAILDTGAPLDELRKAYGSYGEQFLSYFSDAFNNHLDYLVEFQNYYIFEGAALPNYDDYDAFLITGSPAGVYEDHDWLPPLIDFTKMLLAGDKPVIGICFGHQLMAKAAGAKVEKSDKGWGVGAHEYMTYTDKIPDYLLSLKMQQKISCAVSHQDQVLELPEKATLLAGSDFCENGAILYAPHALSFQQHPEFSSEYAIKLMESRRDRIPADRIAVGIRSYETEPNGREAITLAMIDLCDYFYDRHK